MPTGDRPLFRDLGHALTWAYRWQSAPGPTQLAAVHKAFQATVTPECPHGNYQAAADALGVERHEVRQILAPIQDQNAEPVRSRDPDLDPVPYGIDASAQCGFLKSFVARQPTPERWHLLAKFARGDERRQAQRMLRDYLIPLVNNILRPRNILFQSVGHFYGKGFEAKMLARKILYLVAEQEGEKPESRMWRAVRMVRALDEDVSILLQDIGAKTEIIATDELRARGVIR